MAIMKAGEQPVVMVRWWNHAGIETTELPGGGSSDRRDWPRDLDLDAIPLSLAKAENDRGAVFFAGPWSPWAVVSVGRGLRGSMVSVRPALGYSWPAVLMDCQPGTLIPKYRSSERVSGLITGGVPRNIIRPIELFFYLQHATSRPSQKFAP